MNTDKPLLALPTSSIDPLDMDEDEVFIPLEAQINL